MNEQIAYTSVDHIICVTQFAKNALSNLLQLPNEKASVIYNGLKEKKLSQTNKNGLKAQYGFSTDEKIVLYSGVVNERKGVFDLLMAFNKIADTNPLVRLVIAGSGEHSKLLEKTKKHWAKITFTGSLNKKTLYDFYQMADVGVIPSYVEQCSYTAIEMMQHNLPIIAADVDGLKEIIPDNCGLKVRLVLGEKSAHIDTSSLKEKIVYFLQNEKIAKQHAICAKEYALKNHIAKKMAKETVMAYEKLISENNTKTVFDDRNDQPIVSIILPCYNEEKYLERCINSILAQTYSQFELLIIDDGSVDKTISIIKQYNDERIIILKNDQNEGIVSSLNKGIKHAKGKYIARIDADCIMHTERIQKQVAFLEDSTNKEIAIVGSYHYVINSFGKIISLKQYPITDDEIKATAIFHNPFSHPSIMIRSSVFKKTRYSKKYEHAEDYSLWFKVLDQHQGANIPEFLTYYGVGDTNISHKYRKEQKQNTGELISCELDKLNIEYAIDDLAIHIAINQGYGKQYFTTAEKVDTLKNWINKVLSSIQDKYEYSNKFISEMHKYILESYCGIY